MIEQSRGRGFGPNGRDELIPKAALQRAPAAVVKANRALESACESRDGYRATVRQAQAEVHAADGVDHQAKKAAISKGKSVPEPTKPHRQAELAEAQRTLDAAQDVVAEKIADLHRAIEPEIDTWKAAELAALEESVGGAINSIEAAQDAYAEVDQNVMVTASLHGFDPSDREIRKTGFSRGLSARLSVREGTQSRGPERVRRQPEALLEALAEIVQSAPGVAASGPTALELRATRLAAREEERRRREERRARMGTAAGVAQ